MFAIQEKSTLRLLPPAEMSLEPSPVVQLWSPEEEEIDFKQEAGEIKASGTYFYPPILMPPQPKQYIRAPRYEFF